MTLPRIAHIINPVNVTAASDLFIAQPITFESMRVAKRQAEGTAVVDLLAVGYPEDQPMIPPDFQVLPPLTRSVLDGGDFEKQRKLPLLADILDRLYQGSSAELLIYTNVDIGLQPDFYISILEFINEGYDTFAINRRTISNKFTAVDQLPEIYADEGKAHRGWDCFVFPRELLPKFNLGEVCVGATRVGLALLANLVAYGRSFNEFKNIHLTFHIGDERTWKNPSYSDYDDHNTRELMKILSALEEEVGPFKRDTIPGSFLWRKRTFGSLYEFWSRYVALPPTYSALVNRILRG